MKLIDLLVRELPKRGGWPECAAKAEVFTYERGIVNFWTEEGKPFNGGANNFRMKGLSLCEVESVTRAKYEAALSASQKPAWNGEGLPPVGCRVEYTCKQPDLGHPAIYDGKWYGGTIIAYYDDCVWTSDNGIRHLSNTIFRPMRTEADQKRYASIEALFEILDAGVSTSQDAIDIYDAIASGKIPGVKLED